MATNDVFEFISSFCNHSPPPVAIRLAKHRQMFILANDAIPRAIRRFLSGQPPLNGSWFPFDHRELGSGVSARFVLEGLLLVGRVALVVMRVARMMIAPVICPGVRVW